MGSETLQAVIDDEDKEPTLQLFQPKAVKCAIALRTAEAGEKVQVIVLQVLCTYGFAVPEDALVDPRKLP